jgi:hypothetical protein
MHHSFGEIGQLAFESGDIAYQDSVLLLVVRKLGSLLLILNLLFNFLVGPFNASFNPPLEVIKASVVSILICLEAFGLGLDVQQSWEPIDMVFLANLSQLRSINAQEEYFVIFVFIGFLIMLLKLVPV